MKQEERSKEEKIESLANTIKGLEKEYGKGTIMKMGDYHKSQNIDFFSSGSLVLDEALGIGGYPKGRVIEIYGPESSGKTTLALHAIAEAQKQSGICAFIDAEHALDIKYASNIGVDVDNLYLSQPENGEQALEIVDSLVASGSIDVIVVDSVAALTPKAEIEGNMGDAQMALQARLMSQALRKITGSLSKSKTTLIFINQLRMKIGVFFGNPETTTGGNALKFYSSLRIDIRKTETLKKGDDFYGAKTKVKIVKNKVSPPFRIAELVIIYGKGISKEIEVLSLAVKYDIVKKSGSWFSYGGERIGQGQDNCLNYLKENPELFNEIEKKILEKIRGSEEIKVEPENKADKANEAKPEKVKAEKAKPKKEEESVDDFFDDLE